MDWTEVDKNSKSNIVVGNLFQPYTHMTGRIFFISSQFSLNQESLVTMRMDLATPDTNMPPCQDIEQCIEGEEDKGNTKYKWLLIQEDKRLEKHQPKRSVMHPNQHFEGRKKYFSENCFHL